MSSSAESVIKKDMSNALFYDEFVNEKHEAVKGFGYERIASLLQMTTTAGGSTWVPGRRWSPTLGCISGRVQDCKVTLSFCRRSKTPFFWAGGGWGRLFKKSARQRCADNAAEPAGVSSVKSKATQ